MSNKKIDQYYQDILKKSELLTAQEEQALFAQMALGSKRARDKLITANLRFVVNLAMRSSAKGDINDKIMNGNLGLITAIDKFDTAHGTRLTTYAARWINMHIDRGSNKEHGTIYVPDDKAQKIKQLKATSWRLENELGRQATVDELSTDMGLSETKIKNMMSWNFDVQSGDEADVDQPSIFDTYSSNDIDLGDSVDCEMIELRITAALKALTDKEQKIFRALKDDELSLEETGRIFDLSRERVRQINKRVISKLKLCVDNQAVAA